MDDHRVSDAAGDVGEVEPDFYTAEVGAFGADGRGYAGTDVAWGADVAGKLGVNFAELGDLVHGRLIDFFLGVEAGAHGPLVEKVEKRAGFDQADGLGVGKKIEREFEGNGIPMSEANPDLWERIQKARAAAAPAKPGESHV